MDEKLSFQNYMMCRIVDLGLSIHFSLYLIDFITKLQGCGITTDVMFDNVKAFEIKMKVLKLDTNIHTTKKNMKALLTTCKEIGKC
jgi:hypothetical protein